MNYQLNINVTPTQLQQIMAMGYRIIISKSNNGQPSNVAWLNFSPLTQNAVSWNDQPGIYCSTTQIQPGVTISMIASSHAAAGNVYQCDPMRGISYSGQGGAKRGYVTKYVTTGSYSRV
jgi:hypothetical protein